MTTPPLPTESSSIRWQPDLDTDEFLDWNMGVGRLVKATLNAAMDGDLTALANLIRTDPTLVDCNVGYREPLYFAVGNNHLDCVRLLVDNGAEVTYRSGDRTHQRPIERALDRGFDEIAAVLKAAVEERCNCLYINDGETLAEHIRGRDLDRVATHLDRHPDHIRACDERGNVPIHWAVLTMNMSMVRALLDRGADVNASRPDGARPVDLVFGDYFFRRRDVPPEALSENKVMLGYLLAHGAAYDLRTAASVGDTEEVRRQIDADPRVLHRLPDYFTWYTGTALCTAALFACCWKPAPTPVNPSRVWRREGARSSEPLLEGMRIWCVFSWRTVPIRTVAWNRRAILAAERRTRQYGNSSRKPADDLKNTTT